MTSTHFVPGTTITSEWLNDVNAATYQSTVDNLQDLSTLTYAQVSVGNEIFVKSESTLLVVLDASATNPVYDYTPTGGVKLTIAEGVTKDFSVGVKQTAFTQQQAQDMADDLSAMSGYAAVAGTTGGAGYNTYWVLNAAPGLETNSFLWAVDQATTAGGGKIIFFPRGQFDIILTEQVEVTNNITIDAPGRNARIWAPFDVTRLKVIGENVVIRRLQLGATPEAATITERDSIWIEASLADKIWIDQCTFQWSGDAQLDINSVNTLTSDCRVSVTNCYFHNHNKGSLIGSLACYQTGGVPAWCPTALSSQTVHLFVTMRENYWHCVGQRQPKVISQAFVDSINNTVRMAPFQSDDGTTGACYGILTATGGIAKSTNDVFISAYGSGYHGTNSVTTAYVAPTPGVLTIEGPGSMAVSNSVSANGITLNTYNTSYVPTIPYSITPISITDTPEGIRQFVNTIQTNSGASADNVPEGTFRWEGANTTYPNSITSVSETNGVGRWLRVDRWNAYPDYTTSGVAYPTVVTPRGNTLTISSGSITLPDSHVYFAVESEGGASTDDLTDIAATENYRWITLRSSNSAHDITVKNGTGNIRLPGGDYVMDLNTKRLTLMFEDPYWYEISRT